MHGNIQAIDEYLQQEKIIFTQNSSPSELNYKRCHSIGAQPFEYHPYFQKRTHRYANQNRSAIKNADLKETYINFLLTMTITSHYSQVQHKLTHAYYLILQDRLLEAKKDCG